MLTALVRVRAFSSDNVALAEAKIALIDGIFKKARSPAGPNSLPVTYSTLTDLLLISAASRSSMPQLFK